MYHKLFRIISFGVMVSAGTQTIFSAEDPGKEAYSKPCETVTVVESKESTESTGSALLELPFEMTRHVISFCPKFQALRLSCSTLKAWVDDYRKVTILHMRHPSWPITRNPKDPLAKNLKYIEKPGDYLVALKSLLGSVKPVAINYNSANHTDDEENTIVSSPEVNLLTTSTLTCDTIQNLSPCLTDLVLIRPRHVNLPVFRPDGYMYPSLSFIHLTQLQVLKIFSTMAQCYLAFDMNLLPKGLKVLSIENSYSGAPRSYYKLSNCAALEQLTGLQSLTFSSGDNCLNDPNDFSDLSVLPISLVELDLSACDSLVFPVMKDFLPLQRLTNLRTLTVHRTAELPELSEKVEIIRKP